MLTKNFKRIRTLYHYFLMFVKGEIILSQKINNHIIKFIISNHFEYQSRFKLPYTSEPLLVYWAKDIIGPNDIVYDIGANIGNYSLLFAKKIQNCNGKVYSFEPNFINFQKLKRNILLNNLQDCILPFYFGFSNSNNVFVFHENSEGTVGGSGKVAKMNEKGENILCLTLNTLLRFENIKKPNHIKIDIDFNTTKLFEEIDWLKCDELKSVYIEIEKNDELKLLKIFKENNFKLLKQDSEYYNDTKNYLFIKN